MQKGFRRLRVWQESHQLVKMIYKVTSGFPKEEMFGLVSQLRRAVISIPANIAEGYAYHSNKKFLQFLAIANGSLSEIEYYLELAKDMKFISKESYKELEDQRQKVGAYLTKFMKAIREQ